MKKTLRDIDVAGKKVLVRVDFNVPMDGDLITDTTRIEASLPTINYLLENGASVVLMSHLGRPKGEYKEEFSLAPVAKKLSELLKKDVKFVASKVVIDDEVKSEIKKLKTGEVALLENTRFVKGEEKLDYDFAKDLASLADIYVNDAFGTSHRAHASNVGVAKYLPSAMGFLLEKEVEYLEGAVQNPDRPFVAILGGKKVSDKINVIDNLLEKVDTLIVVGGMAYTFFKSMGLEIGDSIVEDDKLDLARELMAKAVTNHVDFVLPDDVVMAKELKAGVETKTVDRDKMEEGYMGLDIGPKTIANIKEKLEPARCVVWNGPCGVFEIPEFANGTFEVAKTLANLEGATTIIGGGDSVAAIEAAGLKDKMTHISTGGGASLELLEGKVLPGIDCIEDAE
ncbi:phosphoglycerate kinase [Peptoniphilus duerdenii ATCC BAA-1640]|uniref:Phosphoglycerate kinase n=2 Tax=Peptoniphilus TaxID=162289 RepID=E0NJT2_9FIRM|nr:phosphoglycerate kinase [Peptoniphilus duerdenii ATCC BAA-1640]